MNDFRNFGIPSTPETYSTHVRSPAPLSRATGWERESNPSLDLGAGVLVAFVFTVPFAVVGACVIVMNLFG